MQVQTVTIPPVQPYGGGGGTPINSADDIIATLDEALGRAEARQEHLAFDYMQGAGVGEAHKAMFADGPRAARKYPPYRVVEFAVVYPIDQILQAAHPSDPKVPALTREQIRANVLRSVGEWEGQARARQGNGRWFLWTVIRIEHATVKSSEQIPSGKGTFMDGVNAQRVYGTASGAEMMDESPTQDMVREVRKPAIEYKLLYIDVSGRRTETMDGKAVQQGPATDGNDALNRLANIIGAAIGKPTDAPAPAEVRAAVTVNEMPLPTVAAVRTAAAAGPKEDPYPGIPKRDSNGAAIPHFTRKAMWDKKQKEAAGSGTRAAPEETPDEEEGT